MRQLYVLLIVFGLAGCSNNTSSEATEDNKQNVHTDEKADSFTEEEANESDRKIASINIPAESFIKELIQLRQAKSEDEIEINGSVFFTQGDLKIINFTENRGGNEYPFVLVLNPASKIDNQLINEDGGYRDIGDFLAITLTGSFAALPGNFSVWVEATENMAGPQPIVLRDWRSFRTNLTGTESVWLVDAATGLTPTAIKANTDAVVGECDGPIGILESVVLGVDGRTVLIEHTEGTTNADQDCASYNKIKSQKEYLWSAVAQRYQEVNDTKTIADALSDNQEVPAAYTQTFIESLGLKTDPEATSQWQFVIHKPGPEVITLCAVSDTIKKLYTWQYASEKFALSTLKSQANIKLTPITQAEFSRAGAKSENIYPSSTYAIDFMALQEERIIDDEAAWIKHDTLYVLAPGTGLRLYSSAEGGKEYYTYVNKIGNDWVVVAKLNYFEGGMSIGHLLVNSLTGKIHRIPAIDGNIHNFHLSPNLQVLAIAYDAGGYDGNYSPEGRLLLYRFTQDGLQLLYDTPTGPSGKVQLKWVDGDQLYYQDYCRSVIFGLRE